MLTDGGMSDLAFKKKKGKRRKKKRKRKKNLSAQKSPGVSFSINCLAPFLHHSAEVGLGI